MLRPPDLQMSPPAALAGDGRGMVRTWKVEQLEYSPAVLQEQRLVRRYHLLPATARATAELAFGRCA